MTAQQIGSLIESTQVAPLSKLARGGLTVSQWSKAAGPHAFAKGGGIALLTFVDLALAEGLVKEIDAALSGQCGAIGGDD
jgi:hypothetical protein